jgi:hypothetical protein
MIYKTRWVCGECYKKYCAKVGRELPIYTIYNSFKSRCFDCGELAESFVDVPIDEPE